MKTYRNIMFRRLKELPKKEKNGNIWKCFVNLMKSMENKGKSNEKKCEKGKERMRERKGKNKRERER
jgi:hypothetical protein